MSTELQKPDATGRIERDFIRDGIAGNIDVLFEMARVVRHAVSYDKGLEYYAKQLLIRHGLNSYSDTGTVCEAIFNSLRPVYDADGFLKSGVAYIEDIGGRVESIKTPRATLSDGYGDCDDQAILVASLLGCVGFEDVRIVMAKYAANDPTFSHVYCAAYKDGKRFVLDTTLPQGELNKEIKPFEKKEINVFDNIEGLDGFGGALNNARYHGRKFAKAAIKALPAAAETLPFGFLAANAFSAGADLIDRAQSAEQLSYNAAASKVNQELDSIIRRLLRSEVALDNAQSRAAYFISQLGTIQNIPTDQQAYKTIRRLLEQKFNFIKDFQKYAAANNIKVVYLDSRAMVAVGGAAVLFTGYGLYKKFMAGRK